MKFISIKELFPSLSTFIPGWIKGTYYCITGATGSGKSKFARYAFAMWTYIYCKANNIPFKVIYFALEESKEFFWTTILLDKLNELHGIRLTYYQYLGLHEGMTPEIQVLADAILPIIEDMKKYIIVYDDVSNPTGLLRTIEKELVNHGELTRVKGELDEQGNQIITKQFKSHDPDFHLVVVADHIGLLSPEKNEHALVNTLHLAISKWSEYVVKLIVKRYNAIVVSVHQQEMAGENNDNFKLNRLEPSETKLGDNKLVGRDYMVTLGLFNPIKYGLSQYYGYNLPRFGDNFRTLHILKHRNGISGIMKAMWFDGVGNKFEELPKSDQIVELNKFIDDKRR